MSYSLFDSNNFFNSIDEAVSEAVAMYEKLHVVQYKDFSLGENDFSFGEYEALYFIEELEDDFKSLCKILEVDFNFDDIVEQFIEEL